MAQELHEVPLELLANAIALVLCIDAMPDDLNPESVSLCPGSRKQLEHALECAGPFGEAALANVKACRYRYSATSSEIGRQ